MRAPRLHFLCAATASLHSSDTLLNDPANHPEWTELFARLTPHKNRQSAFEERRHLPFRNAPIVLKGEIRIVPDRGISLRYLQPERRVIIVDAKGVLIRDDDGHDLAAPNDPRAQAATGALLHVLRFDLPELQKTFAVHGERKGEAWTLAFVPRDPALATTLGTIEVRGQGLRPTRIDMIKSPTQRIEILIGETHENVIFTGDTLKRFFR